jgi:hypothetical protein
MVKIARASVKSTGLALAALFLCGMTSLYAHRTPATKTIRTTLLCHQAD